MIRVRRHSDYGNGIKDDLQSNACHTNHHDLLICYDAFQSVAKPTNLTPIKAASEGSDQVNLPASAT